MEFTPILKSLNSLFNPSPLIQKSAVPQTIMLLSPHPDDECITSSLALRLAHENGAHLINVAVTLGSKKSRQKSRLSELNNACEVLEMELIELSESWSQKEKELKSLIQKYQPSLILVPHDKDLHPTHIKTAELLKKVIKKFKNNPILVAWTEYWGQMKNPNLMVEVPLEILELQMRALEKHKGEIERNPYHLRLPGWMMDNVRRGSEIIFGSNPVAPSFAFATLYRLQLYKNGKPSTPKIEKLISSESDIGQIFKLILDAASGSKTKVK
jgi:LmbE family N-acetylglucosaminyl deacetylase